MAEWHADTPGIRNASGGTVGKHCTSLGSGSFIRRTVSKCGSCSERGTC